MRHVRGNGGLHITSQSQGVTYRVVIVGKVQGVSFRVTLREKALKHKLSGWVRNREDGAVVALLHGREDRIHDLIKWAESGPPGATVKKVMVERVKVARPPELGFAIVY
ncbi:MAG TPA: acylphosphatase [Nitrososphaerales archaeon]|nr:acylphosphatase [Nitrososphaerales archaeon]HUK74645.1 acylphosphatase [Nitrososphaerales archaeon]